MDATSSFSWFRMPSFSYGSIASESIGRVLCVVVTCIFALVCSFVGGVTGALIGLAAESGILRGSGIGALSGAIFSFEIIDSSVDMWSSTESRTWSILHLMDIISSLLSGRLVREKIAPAVQSAVQRQMGAVVSPFMEAHEFLEAGGLRGMKKDSIDKLPRIRITREDNVDGAGENISCSVCLQDLKIGEIVRSLPHCRHMFHLYCIDKWLVKRGSCPLCRRDVLITSTCKS
ncbi:NEP1-interacting protein 1-like isoform X1 [Typha latifolia]|uniref:NEP1-interacting protein 1-like isoform X1 n=1 Tax=Typha latifolia TaxID=4733 RepID=UPI003C2C507C